MFYSNIFVEIQVENVLSRVEGALPSGWLEDRLNKHISNEFAGPTFRGIRAFDADSRTFLTGLLPAVRSALHDLGARYRIADRRAPATGSHAWALTAGTRLRDYQESLVADALRRDMGIIQAGTGAGKTLVGAALVARLGLPAVWIVTTSVLLEQALSDLRRYLGVEPGRIGGGVWAPREITVALVQALSRHRERIETGRYGLMIFDEGHHAAAPRWAEVVLQVGARRNYWLTSVPERAGRDQSVLDALTGGVVTRLPAAQLVAQRWLTPIDVRIAPVVIDGEMTEKQFTTVYREFIVENEQRNAMIAGHASAYAAAGESVLVLVEHVRHGRRLATALPGSELIHGSLPRGTIQRAVEEFRAGRLPILIATASLLAEGVSIDGISALIWAGALKSHTKVVQAVGRGMRRAEGKTRCIYQDYLDRDRLGMLLEHARRRMQILRAAGFDVPSEESIGATEGSAAAVTTGTPRAASTAPARTSESASTVEAATTGISRKEQP